MRKSIFVIMFLCLSMSAYAAFPTNTSTHTIQLDVPAQGDFSDFNFVWHGFEDQLSSFYTVTNQTNYVNISPYYAMFRMSKRVSGGSNIVYVQKGLTDITVSNSNVVFSVARTNVPPNGDYFAQLLLTDNTSTNVIRSLAAGHVRVGNSLWGTNDASFNYPVNSLWQTNSVSILSVNTVNIGGGLNTGYTNGVLTLSLSGAGTGDAEQDGNNIWTVTNTVQAEWYFNSGFYWYGTNFATLMASWVDQSVTNGILTAAKDYTDSATNGLGTAAWSNATVFANAAQGSLADTALQPASTQGLVTASITNAVLPLDGSQKMTGNLDLDAYSLVLPTNKTDGIKFGNSAHMIYTNLGIDGTVFEGIALKDASASPSASHYLFFYSRSDGFAVTALGDGSPSANPEMFLHGSNYISLQTGDMERGSGVSPVVMLDNINDIAMLYTGTNLNGYVSIGAPGYIMANVYPRLSVWDFQNSTLSNANFYGNGPNISNIVYATTANVVSNLTPALTSVVFAAADNMATKTNFANMVVDGPLDFGYQYVTNLQKMYIGTSTSAAQAFIRTSNVIPFTITSFVGSSYSANTFDQYGAWNSSWNNKAVCNIGWGGGGTTPGQVWLYDNAILTTAIRAGTNKSYVSGFFGCGTNHPATALDVNGNTILRGSLTNSGAFLIGAGTNLLTIGQGGPVNINGPFTTNGAPLAVGGSSSESVTNQADFSVTAASFVNFANTNLVGNRFVVSAGRLWINTTNNGPHDVTANVSFFNKSTRIGESIRYKATGVRFAVTKLTNAVTTATNLVYLADATAFTTNQFIALIGDTTEIVFAITNNGGGSFSIADVTTGLYSTNQSAATVMSYGGVFSGTNNTLWGRIDFGGNVTADKISNWMEY